MPEETWAAWNSVFDRLDTDGDNVMSPGELRQGEAELNPSDEKHLCCLGLYRGLIILHRYIGITISRYKDPDD